MPASALSPPRARSMSPVPASGEMDSLIGSQEPQDGAVSDAESNASNVTIEMPIDEYLRRIQAYRDRLSILGGKPTRPVAEYSREQEASNVFLAPHRPGAIHFRTDDEEYYRCYLDREAGHFYNELSAWESFLRWMRRKWVQRNEAAGGTLPPLAPVLEMDPLFLHTEYLRFLLIVLDELEELHPADSHHFPYWYFADNQKYLEHVISIESRVSALREERGLGHEPIFQHLPGPREQLRLVPEKIQRAIDRLIVIRPGDANHFAQFFQARSASPPPAELPHHQNGRKRTREDDNVEPDVTSSTAAGTQDDHAPAAKRSKREIGKRAPKASTDSDIPPKQPRGRPPKSRRGKATAKSAPVVEAEDPGVEPAPGSRKAGTEAGAAPQRRGRRPKKSQPASAADATRQEEVPPIRKGRGRPKKAAAVPAQGGRAAGQSNGKQRIEKRVATAARKPKNTAAVPPATGSRRSARIAARQ